MGCNCSSLATHDFIMSYITSKNNDWKHADDKLFPTNDNVPSVDFNDTTHISRRGNFTVIAALLTRFESLTSQDDIAKANQILANILHRGIAMQKNKAREPVIDLFHPIQRNGDDVISMYCLELDRPHVTRMFLGTLLDAVDDDPRLGDRGRYFIKLFEDFQRYDRRTLGMAQNDPNVRQQRHEKFTHCLLRPVEVLLDHNVGLTEGLNRETMFAKNTVLHELFSSSAASGFSPEYELQLLQAIISSGKNLSSIAKVRDEKLKFAPFFVGVMCACAESVQEICANASKFGIYGKEDLVDERTGRTVFHFAFGRERAEGQLIHQRDDVICQVIQTLFTLPGANDIKNNTASIALNSNVPAHYSPYRLAVEANNTKAAELLKLNGCH